MYNNEYFQNMSMEKNMSMENNIDGNNNYVNNDMDVDVNVSNGPSMNQPMPMGEAMGQPVQQRVINRTFVHEVPQDCSFMIEK